MKDIAYHLYYMTLILYMNILNLQELQEKEQLQYRIPRILMMAYICII